MKLKRRWVSIPTHNHTLCLLTGARAINVRRPRPSGQVTQKCDEDGHVLPGYFAFAFTSRGFWYKHYVASLKAQFAVERWLEKNS